MRPSKQTGTGRLLLGLQVLFIVVIVVDGKVRLNDSLIDGRRSGGIGGGYIDLVVALPTFTNDIRIVQRVVANIQALLTNASEVLHRATDGRLYFEEVTILLPTVHWYNGSSYLDTDDSDGFFGGPVVDAKADETYGLADVRVSAHLTGLTEAADLLPRTVQRGDCGEPGDFILMSAGFLALISNDSFVGRYGDPSKAFVAQWARYRFGVFGENDPTRFYYHPERRIFEAAQCADFAVTGWFLDSESGFLCSADRKVSVPSKECRFFYGTIGNDGLTSSLLFDTKLPHVSEFCDEITHNRYAPTMQNRRCGARSALEVMEEHDDLDRLGQSDVPPPRFRFVRSNHNASIVLLVDLSVLTSHWSPALVSLRKYIMFVVPEGTALELTFINSTYQMLPFQQTIRENSDRETFFEYIHLVIAGNSSAELLRSSPPEVGLANWQSGVVMCIVASDNFLAMNWTSRLDGAHFVPIFLDVQPQEHLVQIAEDTGGTVHALVGSRFHLESDLDSTLLQVSDRFTDVFDIIPIANGVLKKQGSIPDRFLVDASVVSRLKVVVSVVSSLLHQNSSRLAGLAFIPEEAAVLVSPSAIYGRKNIQAMSMDSLVRSQTLAEFRLDNAQPGLWSLRRGEHYDPDNCVVVFQVFAVLPGRNAMRPKPVIRVGAQLDRATVEEGNLVPRLTVSLMHGNNVYASSNTMINVTASINLPHNKRTLLKVLNDEGKGADVIANDGVFSTFMSHIYTEGIYRVAPLVTGGNAMSCLLGRVSDCFQRSPAPLYFEVKPFSWNLSFSDRDWMPPDTIRDFSLVATKSDAFHFDATIATLGWTSPGGNYDSGIVEGYDMRYFQNWTATENFTAGEKVTAEMVYRGDLANPKPAGYRESVSVRFRRLNDSFDVSSSIIFVAVQAYDAGGNYGNTSNIVSIPVAMRTPILSSTPTPNPTATTTSGETTTSPLETTAMATTATSQTNVTTSENATSSTTTLEETTATTTLPTTNATSNSDNVTDYVVDVSDRPMTWPNDTNDGNVTIVIVIPTLQDTHDKSTGTNDVGHSHDGVIASAILLIVALVILFACFIHIRFYSRRSKQNRFAYEEFQVGERIASRIEH